MHRTRNSDRVNPALGHLLEAAFAAEIQTHRVRRPTAGVERFDRSILGGIKRQKASLPIPMDDGSTTPSTAAVAIAASMALPPFMRISTPANVASGWLEATMPFLARTENCCP